MACFMHSRVSSTCPYLLQSLSGSINQCLTERLILRDCLEDGPLGGDIADCPLAHTGTAQPEQVTL